MMTSAMGGKKIGFHVFFTRLFSSGRLFRSQMYFPIPQRHRMNPMLASYLCIISLLVNVSMTNSNLNSDV